MVDWKLFIDDERFPITPDWYIARNSYEAIYALQTWGMPSEIAYDHDLKGSDTAMVFIKKMDELLELGSVEFPPHFKYSVHSQNPVGAMNIRSYMEFLLKHY